MSHQSFGMYKLVIFLFADAEEHFILICVTFLILFFK